MRVESNEGRMGECEQGSANVQKRPSHSLGREVGKVWNVLQKLRASGGIVHAAGIVGQTVRDKKIACTQSVIVGGYLAKNGLGDGHSRRLIFHDDQRLRRAAAVDHRVAAAGHTAQRHAHLVHHQSRREMLVVEQKRHKMLPHPLLGSERHILGAQNVKHHQTLAFACRFYICCGQV